ncbi:MAG: hypothetical protein P4N41_07325 [Negativicutes bacterium]|nr:hypothetical protein [Negativicutes bacterium]
MDSDGKRKMDELFRQIWTLEQTFAREPSAELAETLVVCLNQVGSRGYFNPVLGVSWTPFGMARKLKSYQGYLDSDPSAGPGG